LVKMFKAEQRALRALEGTPGVPRLLRTGHRYRGDPRGPRGNMFPVPWPLLLMSPVGTPLDGELAARLDAARAAGAPPTVSVRRAFADEVLSGVHVALRAAHAARLIHCDVRPSNVAVADGAPLLLDWGLARAQGAEASGYGDALFALDPVFLQASYAACAWQDLASAALLWVAIAHGAGDSCDAPWLAHSDAGRTLDERRTWLRAAADKGDAALSSVLERLERAEARRELTAADYEWLPTH
jgi:serine/threonine protein kinase